MNRPLVAWSKSKYSLGDPIGKQGWVLTRIGWLPFVKIEDKPSIIVDRIHYHEIALTGFISPGRGLTI